MCSSTKLGSAEIPLTSEPTQISNKMVLNCPTAGPKPEQQPQEQQPFPVAAPVVIRNAGMATDVRNVTEKFTQLKRTRGPKRFQEEDLDFVPAPVLSVEDYAG